MARSLPKIRTDDGFGMIEVLIAMTIVAVGLLSMFATFASGFTTTQRANMNGTASMLADQTMETFRGGQYSTVTAGTTTFSYSATTTPPSPDGRGYTVSATVTSGTATNTGGSTARAQKVISVTVTETSTSRTLVTETSMLDPLSGT